MLPNDCEVMSEVGSTGRGRDLDIDRLTPIAERIKQQLREGDETPRRNVFIARAYEDEDFVNLLRGQAKDPDSKLEFNDWSLREPFDSERAEYIRSGIRERIRQSSATLVYLSEHSADSRWVDWEIRESLALGKKVVCVYQRSPPARIPPAATELGLTCVPWQHEAIMRALEKD